MQYAWGMQAEHVVGFWLAVPVAWLRKDVAVITDDTSTVSKHRWNQPRHGPLLWQVEHCRHGPLLWQVEHLQPLLHAAPAAKH
jgi:hypothetical protein